MRYDNIRSGIFKDRPNRFIANVEIEGEICVCHVKNTGRCRELLVPGAEVYVTESSNPSRKTRFDLVAVKKGKRLFNIDSQAPNKVVFEWLKKGEAFDNIKAIKPEYKYNNSRFDFYVETNNEKVLIEVKGVTLEKDGVLLFPDAPTERGLRHIRELCLAKKDGYKTQIIFVVQTDRAKYFTPNAQTHPEFCKALRQAAAEGVEIFCRLSKITPDTLEIDGLVPVKL